MKYFREDPRRALGGILILMAVIGPFAFRLPIFPAIALFIAGLMALLAVETTSEPPQDGQIRHDIESDSPSPDADSTGPELRPSGTDYKLIATSYNYALIQIWSETLRDKGIPTEIRDDFAGSMLFQYSRVVGEIKLLVPAEHAQEALSILQTLPKEQTGEAVQVCPNCGSMDIRYSGEIIPFMVLTLVLFNFGLPLHRKKNKCIHCSEKWAAHSA
tara:strand:- start:42 stop:689 length:648 start_codon:yes stop_codon:yes gene_type:complete